VLQRRGNPKGAPPLAVAAARFTVNGTAADVFTCTLEGEELQLTPLGAPEHATATVPANPESGLTCKLKAAAWLEDNVAEVGAPAATVIEKSSAMPAIDTVCGPPGALSVTFKIAARDPLAMGLNTTLMVQDPPGLMFVSQLSVSEKSLAFVPLNEIALAERAPVPVLVNVTGMAAPAVPTNSAGNERLAGDTLALVPMPVPLSDID
jgi:hypothetical protein